MNHQQLAQQLNISADDAETLVIDILPVLKRKYEMIARRSDSTDIGEAALLRAFIEQELGAVLNNYALVTLQKNRGVLQLIIKNLSHRIDGQQTDQILNQMLGPSVSTANLADDMAAELGIHSSYLDAFKTRVLPRIKKYTVQMVRKKIQNGESLDHQAGFTQFIIDNVFIDEFENHPFIRSNTDENNKAILLPQVKAIAEKLIAAWINEVIARK